MGRLHVTVLILLFALLLLCGQSRSVYIGVDQGSVIYTGDDEINIHSHSGHAMKIHSQAANQQITYFMVFQCFKDIKVKHGLLSCYQHSCSR